MKFLRFPMEKTREGTRNSVPAPFLSGGAPDEVLAFPNGKDKRTRQNSILAPFPFLGFA